MQAAADDHDVCLRRTEGIRHKPYPTVSLVLTEQMPYSTSTVFLIRPAADDSFLCCRLRGAQRSAAQDGAQAPLAQLLTHAARAGRVLLLRKRLERSYWATRPVDASTLWCLWPCSRSTTSTTSTSTSTSTITCTSSRAAPSDAGCAGCHPSAAPPRVSSTATRHTAALLHRHVSPRRRYARRALPAPCRSDTADTQYAFARGPGEGGGRAAGGEPAAA